jgi:hypothetical protein
VTHGGAAIARVEERGACRGAPVSMSLQFYPLLPIFFASRFLSSQSRPATCSVA